MTQPVPSDPMTGRWSRELADMEIKTVLNAQKFDTAEWDWCGFEFFCSKKMLAIVRTSGMGGDTYNVHGGWRYPNLIALLQDWTEICSVASKVTTWGKTDE